MKKSNKIIKAVVFNPDLQAEPAVREMREDMHEIQAVIGCNGFEVYARKIGGVEYTIFCDEIGMYKGLTPSALNNEGYCMFVGRLVITGFASDGDIKSLTDKDVERIRANVIKTKDKQFLHCEY